MNRDELVQAAIEALDADNPGSTYIDTEIDCVDGSLTDVVRAVVDTVLAKLGATPVIPRHADGRPVHVTSTDVDIHDVSYTATTFFDE
jgi:hypothetical protein